MICMKFIFMLSLLCSVGGFAFLVGGASLKSVYNVVKDPVAVDSLDSKLPPGSSRTSQIYGKINAEDLPEDPFMYESEVRAVGVGHFVSHSMFTKLLEVKRFTTNKLKLIGNNVGYLLLCCSLLMVI